MAPIPQDPRPDSLFHLVKLSQWISLPPASLSNPLPAIGASFFSPLLLTYYPPARGIILAWQDIELSDSPPSTTSTSTRTRKPTTPSSESDDEDTTAGAPLLLKVVDEYSAPFLWATATFLVFRPRKDAFLENARVTSQANTHITLSYLNAFSISVVRSQLPRDWNWSGGAGYSMTGGSNREGEGDGYWMDADGMPIPETLKVRVRDWDAGVQGKGRGFLRIEGSLVEEQEGVGEGEREGERREKGKTKAKSALKRNQNGATQGEAMEVE
ncbi:hypothetical protein M011DRAFT_494394 [Sporormia fimetaria CBS 119925]|uniref:DNA-directed RNA polymerase I subunit RPA43 n=1 Tax=Sporormia fimetaria CBS 119925 TaxID=1340428 RepID=A0A6A6VAT3_9PLEO|nr:hypothetical protein M011DRAFT_494394 [Sporormia fimetaria CBS 119925]